MPDSALIPLLDHGDAGRSLVVGAPRDFDFLSSLRTASDVRIAMAFGHMSGWARIEDALVASSAKTVHILLGQAFFQTERQLLLRLKGLQESAQSLKFEVKLASVSEIFHPKVWIIGHSETPLCIVGSGNLSGGGLSSNVECGLVTLNIDHIDALRGWFDRLWASTLPLERTLEKYLNGYQKTEAARKSLKALIEATTSDQADNEATWHRRTAIQMAVKFWRSDVGAKAIKERVAAIAQMRTILDYPHFNFGAAEWGQFLRIPELGRIRLGYEKQTTAALAKLKNALQNAVMESTKVEDSVERLQAIAGIGRNLATKLLAVCQPDRFVVVNEPVESALHAFGYDVEPGPGISGKGYRQFLKDLTRFIEECSAIELDAAPALDAFFYAYKDLTSNTMNISGL